MRPRREGLFVAVHPRGIAFVSTQVPGRSATNPVLLIISTFQLIQLGADRALSAAMRIQRI